MRPRIEARRSGELVEGLLQAMSLREKVGQMTQLDLGMLADGEGETTKLDPEKVRTAIVDFGVGSILNTKGEALPLATWHEVIRGIQAAAATTRHAVPVLYGIDSIHGANYLKEATLFPQPLGMASTFNPRLMLEASAVTAAETRAAGLAWNFSPVLDVGRHAQWPRLYETFGEDVYLATVMGVASVQGYQGSRLDDPTRVAATLKHFVGYSLPGNGHDRAPAWIPEPQLREYFLPPFAAAVRSGAASVMLNSGEVNGIPGHINRYLIEDVLRKELGFQGVVLSDWEDIRKLVTVHRVAADEKEATRMAVMAGVDVSMVPYGYSFVDLLVELVEEGSVPMARIDEAVRRVLNLKVDLGLFDDPLLGLGSSVEVGAETARELSLETARQSLVLLKNDSNVLPFDKSARLLVTGPTADSQVSLNNGWTYVWQGDRAEVYPEDRPTVVEGLRELLGEDQVRFLEGATYDRSPSLSALREMAKSVDAIVVCLGEDSYTEMAGNIGDMDLPAAQIELTEAALATGKPVVLVLVEGRPRVIRPIADGVRGILLGFNPGLEGGRAIAEALVGDFNPSGRLPVTYPKFSNSLSTYDAKPGNRAEGLGPQFEFGFGLGYTPFEYSRLEVSPLQVSLGEPLEVSVVLHNRGDRRGMEVVQLFVSDDVASVAPPEKRLRRFAKVDLGPGEGRRLRFRLPVEALSFVGPDGHATLEPGTFRVQVGGLEKEFSVVTTGSGSIHFSRR